jgi:hypothetical protein
VRVSRRATRAARRSVSCEVDPPAWPAEAVSSPRSPRVVQEKRERWPLAHRE